MLENGHLVVSVTNHWREQFPEDCRVIEPGLQQDASRWDCWVELTFPWVREHPGRQGGLQTLEVLADTHCFAVRNEDWGRIQRVVEAARESLAGRTVVVRESVAAALPAIGYVKFGDAEVRDLTRLERHVGGRALFHFLVSVRGFAQMVGT